MSGHNAAHDLFDADFTIADPGNGKTIAADRQGGVVELVTAAAETRALANPIKTGHTITLAMKTDGGNCVVTAASAINQSGNTIMTFADAGDQITLVSIPNGSAYRWSVVGNDGVALS